MNRLIRAAQAALDELQEQQESDVACATLERDGKPDWSTMDEVARPYIEKRQGIIEELRAALGDPVGAGADDSFPVISFAQADEIAKKIDPQAAGFFHGAMVRAAQAGARLGVAIEKGRAKQ